MADTKPTTTLTPAVALPTQLLLDIDRASPIPLYFQVASRIEQAISDGQLPPGSRLENEITLGERLNLSRPTVRRAMQELVRRGLLVRRRGIGTQVVQRPVSRHVELSSLYEDLAALGQHPSTRTLTHEVIAADPVVAERLSVDIAGPVLHLRRVRLADGVPLAILENFLPHELVGLEVAELETAGLYQLMRARGIQISVAQQRIGARTASGLESRLLELGRNGPVLTMDRTAYDSSGRAVEFGQHCYRPDLYSFEITLVET